MVKFVGDRKDMLSRDTQFSFLDYFYKEGEYHSLVEEFSLKHNHLDEVMQQIFSSISSESQVIDHAHIIETLKKKRGSFSVTFPESKFSEESEKQTIKVKEKKYEGSWIHYLNEQKGEMWDEIKNLPNKALIEQLVDLWLMMEKREAVENKKTSQRLFCFAIHMAELASNPSLNGNYIQSRELLREAQSVIGKLIFLVQQKNYFQFLDKIKANYQDILQSIHIDFKKHLECEHKNWVKDYEAQKITDIQSTEIARCIQIPHEIAHYLISERGTVNFGIIDLLLEFFISDPKKMMNHELTLYQNLKLFKHIESLRAEIESIKAPPSKKKPSYRVMLASLQKPFGEEISDIETKKVVLASCISHLRQGSVGTCFATSIAIDILSLNMSLCLRDLKEIIQEGMLKRTVKGVMTKHPFVNNVADENLDKLIQLDSLGYVKNDDQKIGLLSDLPGIRRACNSVGLKNPEEALQSISKVFSEEHKDLPILSVREWLIKICEWAIKNGKTDQKLGDLYTQAALSFSSLSFPVFLKIWENSIAGMAEAHEQGLIKRMIALSINHALKAKLQALNIRLAPNYDQFLNSIQQVLMHSIELQYDPTVGQNGTEGRYLGKGGGFVMYVDQAQVKNHIDFRKTVQEIIRTAYQDLCDSNKSLYKEVSFIFDIFNEHVLTDDFLKELLKKYYEQRRVIPDLNKDFDSLQYTPWVTKCGNSSKTVWEIYLEVEHPIISQSFESRSPKVLFENIINMGKQLNEKEVKSYEVNSNKLIPLRIVNHHSFSLMLGHSSLKIAWLDKGQADLWIQKNVVEPGLQVSKATFSSESRAKFILDFKNIIKSFLTDSEIEQWEIKLKKIPLNMAIHKFREAIFELSKACKEDFCREIDLTRLKIQIDKLISENLTPSLMKKLKSSAVIVADTNWFNGIHDIFLCFMVNPGSGELELCKTYDNMEQFFFIDQKEWVCNKKWEYFYLPETIK